MSKKKKKTLVSVSARDANLKRRLRRHLKSIGFSKGPEGGLVVNGEGKDVIRALHRAQRNAILRENRSFINDQLPQLQQYFASGNDVDPSRIKPELELIDSGTWQSALFRLAALTWSVPVSHGFGRRLRYLVWDRSNNKLIGLMAIGDPVFNLSVRDKLIGWNSHQRGDRLVNIMDAYVLGAVPPYNMLLGGKLIAALIRSRDVYDDFTNAYGNTTGIISGKEKRARLLAVTTSSSLGRSSVYNRLKLDGKEYLKPIGYTGGWGHFHIPDDLFADLRAYLRQIGHSYADLHRFGQGPNWRLRTTRAALAALGFKADMLKHGIQREVFICELATNALSVLRKGKGRPNLKTLLSASEVAALAVKRWMVPRSETRPEYQHWQANDIKLLLNERSGLTSTKPPIAIVPRMRKG
jgi:hypothetical protein